jgi:hypothetical protein
MNFRRQKPDMRHDRPSCAALCKTVVCVGTMKRGTGKKDKTLAVPGPVEEFDDTMRRVMHVKPPPQWKFLVTKSPKKRPLRKS